MNQGLSMVLKVPNHAKQKVFEVVLNSGSITLTKDLEVIKKSIAKGVLPKIFRAKRSTSEENLENDFESIFQQHVVYPLSFVKEELQHQFPSDAVYSILAEHDYFDFSPIWDWTWRT